MLGCDHNWNSDKDVRYCLKCGQVRTFPGSKGEPRILWDGTDDNQTPLELPAVDKADIARLAQMVGLTQLASVIKVPWGILRAWVAAYCRKPKPDPEPVATPGPEAKVAEPAPTHLLQPRRIKMESEIMELAKKVQQAVGELEVLPQTPLTESAIKIATIALKELAGDALSKALKLSASIVEFENEIKFREL